MAALINHRGAAMKPNNKLQKFVLAAVLALPFGIASADEVPELPPPGAYGGAPGMNADASMPPGMDGRTGPGRPGPGLAGRGPRTGGDGAPGFHGQQGPLGHPGGAEQSAPPPGAPGMPPPFLHGLDLTEAQQDKVFTILHGQAPYVREQDKALRKAREALRALASSARYDDAKAASLAQAAAQAMSNLELSRVRTEQKLLAVLTAEQRKQVEQRLAALPQRGPRL
jgi:periplasmic protein CpxP/Spy